jgi:ribose-phosphate pyrophosphokinase
VARVQSSVLKSMVVTDSIQATSDVMKCSNIRRISIAPLIGEALRRINNEESVSSLFD